ncbi:MAG: LysR family transcriptional regulator [Actinomycetia bacterium]|nr:LysR family transcriptional regulator [Actinomycetes bacterium]
MTTPAERSPGARFTLRQLEYFVAVAEAGTVTAAAERVHLSQSAMSTALADLERVLGVQLLVRHHARGVTLTPSGDELLISARELLRQADDLDTSAHALGEGLVGRVRLGCFAILAPYLVPPLVASVVEELPGLEVEPIEEPLDGIESGLREGRFEVALTYDLGLGEGIERQPLLEIRPHALLAFDHPLSTGEPVRLADLANEPFVLLDLPHSRDYFRAAFTSAGVQPRIRYRTRSAETARALVGRGLGWSLLNLRPSNDESLEGRRVVACDLADSVPALTVVLAKAHGTRLTKRALALEKVAIRVLAQRPVGMNSAS